MYGLIESTPPFINGPPFPALFLGLTAAVLTSFQVPSLVTFKGGP